MASSDLRGYLVVKVLQVSGKSAEEEAVWDSSLKEAFIKIEVRGGARTVKKQTTIQPVNDGVVTFDEQLTLEILDGAKELRIMLCRQRRADGKAGTSVIAACGIYMQDILEAVPIDKFFDLFKPGMGSDGGFVRICMSYLTPDQVRGDEAALLLGADKVGGGYAEQRPEQQPSPGARRGGLILKATLVVAALGALAAFSLVGKGARKGEEAKAEAAPANGKLSVAKNS